MPVSALVVTLDAEPDNRQKAFDALMARDWLTLGETIEDAHLPVVLESDTLSQGEERFREILALEGVVHVDVVMVDFQDVEEFEEMPRRKKNRRPA